MLHCTQYISICSSKAFELFFLKYFLKIDFYIEPSIVKKLIYIFPNKKVLYCSSTVVGEPKSRTFPFTNPHWFWKILCFVEGQNQTIKGRHPEKSALLLDIFQKWP